ncbi:MAG: hypothetical protein PVF87_07345 [Acidimicrobiia bacterium]|jgi:hypothetical protein
MTNKKWLTRVITVAVASSVVVYFVVWFGLVLAANNFDVAYALGIPEALLIAITAIVIGFIVGLLTAVSGGVKGRMMLMVGMIGAGVYLAVSPIAMLPVDLGLFGGTIMGAAVVTGCVLATRWAYQKTHPTPTGKDNEPKVLVA